MTPPACYFCRAVLEPAQARCEACGRPQILQSAYRITRPLGQGGYGTVYEADDVDLPRRYAVKRITPLSPEHLKQIKEEANILAEYAAKFPFIPDIYKWITEGPDVYLVMQYVDGETIGDILKRQGQWTPGEVEHFLRVTLDHLARLHRAGVVHRDLKPDNIKRTPEGQYVLLDFGIAKQNGITLTAAKAHTPDYAAPEQVLGQPTDARTDLYSLAATAYTLLTGQLPDPSFLRVRYNIQLSRPSELVSELPRSLDVAIMRMLALEPGERPQNASDALTLLDEPTGRPPVTVENVDRMVEVSRVCDGRVSDMAFAPSGRILAIATSIGIELWSTRTWTMRQFIDCSSSRVAWKPDGSSLAAASGNIIQLYSTKGRLLDVLEGHAGEVTAIAWSPQGDTLASASRDGTVRLWVDGIMQATLEDHNGPVTGIAWSPDGLTLASASQFGNVYLWDADGTPRETPTWLHYLLGLPRDGTGPPDEESLEKDYRNRQLGNVTDLTWSPDGDKLGVTFSEGAVLLRSLDGRSQQELLAPEESSEWSVQIAWNPEEPILATLHGHSVENQSSVVRVWETDPGTDGDLVSWTSQQVGHRSEGVAICWSPNGRKVVTASRDGTVLVWRIDQVFPTTPLLDRALQRLPSYANGLVWQPGRPMLSFASLDRTVRLVIADGTLYRLMEGHTEQLSTLSWSPNGQVLASASDDRTIRLWDAEGSLRRTIQVWNVGRSLSEAIFSDRTGVAALGWSPDGSILASLSSLGAVRLWALTGELRRELDYQGSTVWVQPTTCAIKWNPRGSQLACALSNGQVWLRDENHTINQCLEDWTVKRQLGFFPPWPRVIAWSPDGLVLATESDTYGIRGRHHETTPVDNLDSAEYEGLLSDPQSHQIRELGHAIRLWEPDGTLVGLLNGHSARITALAWSPDSSMLASASEDRTVRLWQSDGRPIATLVGHEDCIFALAWSTDGQLLASGSGDQTIRVWDRDGAPRCVLTGHHGDVTALAWSPDQRTLASASGIVLRIWKDLEMVVGDGTVRLWGVEQ